MNSSRLDQMEVAFLVENTPRQLAKEESPAYTYTNLLQLSRKKLSIIAVIVTLDSADSIVITQQFQEEE